MCLLEEASSNNLLVFYCLFYFKLSSQLPLFCLIKQCNSYTTKIERYMYHVVHSYESFRDWSFSTKLENHRSKTQDRVKPFAPTPPSPLLKGRKLQIPVLKLPQNCVCPAFSMAKTLSAPPPPPPFLCKDKTSPPPPLVNPPPRN